MPNSPTFSPIDIQLAGNLQERHFMHLYNIIESMRDAMVDIAESNRQLVASMQKTDKNGNASISAVSSKPQSQPQGNK